MTQIVISLALIALVSVMALVALEVRRKNMHILAWALPAPNQADRSVTALSM